MRRYCKQFGNIVSKRTILTVLLIILGVTCRQKNEVPVPAVRMPIQPYEYEVYKFVITHVEGTSSASVVYVVDSTLPTYPVAERFYRTAPKTPGSDSLNVMTYHDLVPGSFTPNTFITLKDFLLDSMVDKFKPFFESTNSFSYEIAVESLQVYKHVRRIGRDSELHSADSLLYRKGKLLMIWFSRVALDSTGTDALLYNEYLCGYTCGAGQWFWLKKENGSWTIHKSLRTWVS